MLFAFAALQCACRAQRMANGQSQGIGGIGGSRHFGEVQNTCHHTLHLNLLRLPVTGDSQLGFGRRMQRHGNIALRGGEHGEREQLVSCYRNSLRLAKEHGCETVAFPLISSGIFGYPKDQALRVAVDTIGAFLLEHDMTVYLIIFDRRAYQISGKLFADIAEYIDDHYVEAHTDPGAERLRRGALHREMAAPMCAPMAAPALDDLLEHLDAGFSETLLRLIDRSGKKDSEVYKKANVDRKLFSKIRNNPNYKPSKPTALAFAIALELDLAETKDLLARAGYALSASSKFDVVVEYFIRQGNYDIFAINEALFAFDQSLLGA